MFKINLLNHPLFVLAAYLLVPLVMNILVACSFHTHTLPVEALVLAVPGAVAVIQWGWAGLLCCVAVGLLIGLPIVGLQRAYLYHKIQALRDGARFQRVFILEEYVIMMTAPWLMGMVVGHLIGSLLVFPPVGGPLIAVNVLWARTLVYPSHRQAYLCARRFAVPQPAPETLLPVTAAETASS